MCCTLRARGCSSRCPLDADYEQQRFDPLGVELRGSLAFGLSGSAKYRIWEREKAFRHRPRRHGSSLLAAGIGTDRRLRTDKYGAEVRLIADHEIVLKKLFVALNLAFNPEAQNWPDGSATQTSIFEASGAVSARVTNSVYMGRRIALPRPL